MSENPGLVIIEDHPVMAEGLAALFAGTGRWRVMGKAPTLAKAKELLARTQADIVLLDIKLKDDCALDIIPWLRQQSRFAGQKPKIPLLAVYTAFDDYVHVSTALGMGVQAYICKHRSGLELEDILLKVFNGAKYIDEEVQTKLETVAGFLNHLTRREAEILTLVKDGLSNGQIASQLGISRRTVENILSCVYDKTGIRSRLKLQQL